LRISFIPSPAPFGSDTQAKYVARLVASLHGTVKFDGGLFAPVQKDSGFVFEQQLVHNEAWLPSYSEAHFAGRVLLHKGFKVNEVDRFRDYRKFSMETKILPVSAPPNSPAASNPVHPR
jgi:hypothetical protein